jgi:glycosyltransferase involved in cell wall biosynthesis
MSAQGIVLYDFLHCRGGAEAVSLVLAQGLQADLGFGYRDTVHFPDNDLKHLNCIDLRISARFPGARTFAGIWAYRHRTAFLSRYSWVVYSGSVAPAAVYNHRGGFNVYYCHTVPRFAYDLRRYYEASGPLLQRAGTRLLGPWVRAHYSNALQRMDVVIANSENVRGRLQRYLGVDARVIHPPCDVTGYRWRGQGDYYLSTARLEPYKRVDLVLQAFRAMPTRRLLITSGGSQENALRQMAAGAPNIEFTGWVDRERLRGLIGNCIATLYIPKDEDFGMSPVESLAAGKPVIGVAEGGLLETLEPEQSAILIPPPPSVADVVTAVEAMSTRRALAMREACERRAARFSADRFLERVRAVVVGPRNGDG